MSRKYSHSLVERDNNGLRRPDDSAIAPYHRSKDVNQRDDNLDDDQLLSILKKLSDDDKPQPGSKRTARKPTSKRSAITPSPNTTTKRLIALKNKSKKKGLMNKCKMMYIDDIDSADDEITVRSSTLMNPEHLDDMINSLDVTSRSTTTTVSKPSTMKGSGVSNRSYQEPVMPIYN